MGHVPDPAALGHRLRELRTVLGVSQRQLAFPGCTAVYICRIEAGDRTPSLQVADEIARRLGTSSRFLIHGEEDPAVRALHECGIDPRSLKDQHLQELTAVLDRAAYRAARRFGQRIGLQRGQKVT